MNVGRWVNALLTRPTNVAQVSDEDLPAGETQGFQYPYSSATDSNTPYILFVHGWNMSTYDKDRFGETAFKRLYWQGYQGRFGGFRWLDGQWLHRVSGRSLRPTRRCKDNYDSSEYQAWQSAAGFAEQAERPQREISRQRLYMLAHSMGNVAASEALRIARNNQVVNTYVASQKAAVTAHTYDTPMCRTIHSFTSLTASRSLYPLTPPTFTGNWFAGNSGAGAGQVISFYNTNDFAFAAFCVAA